MARLNTRARATSTDATTSSMSNPDNDTAGPGTGDGRGAQGSHQATKSRGRRPVRKVKQTAQTDAQIQAVEELRRRMLAEKGETKNSAAIDGLNKNVAAAVTAAVTKTNQSASKNASAKTTTTPARRTSSRRLTGLQNSASESVKDADQLVAEALQNAARLNDDADMSSADRHSAVKTAAAGRIRPKSSVSVLKNFERRKRQPSLLNMVQQGVYEIPDAPSHTTKNQSTAGNRPTVSNTEEKTAMDTSVDETDPFDFRPDHESTPVNILRSRTNQQASHGPVEDDEDLYGYSPQPNRPSRKRKSDEMEAGHDESEVQVPRSPNLGQSPVRPRRTLRRQESSLHEVIPSTEPTENQLEEENDDDDLPQAVAPQADEDPLSETYADPLSSSPSVTTRQQTAEQSNRPKVQAGVAPRRTGRTADVAHAPKNYTSADLRLFLPRRQTVRLSDSQHDYEFPSSSPSHVDDSRLAAASKRRKATNGQKNSIKANTSTKSKTTASTGRRAPLTKTKSTGRNTRKPIVLDSSDKENEPASSPPPPSSSPGLPSPGKSKHKNAFPSSPTQPSNDEDANSTPRPGKKKTAGEDLKAAAAKFKEIDDWDLEFESAPSLGDRAGHEQRKAGNSGKSNAGQGKNGKRNRRRVDDEVGRCSSGAEWR